MTQKRLVKGVRRCPNTGKLINCNGLCNVVYGHTDQALGVEGSDDLNIICPYREYALDRVLNGGHW